jgi:prepilin-type N-terminal cleavage/methylation domain-containing protein
LVIKQPFECAQLHMFLILVAKMFFQDERGDFGVSCPLDDSYMKCRDWLEASRAPRAANGFTLVELLTVTAVIGIISAIAIPSFSSYCEKCSVMAAVSEITGMIKEAKQNALCDDRDYGIGFDPALEKVTLISGTGKDGKWNTADDQAVRSFRLADKGGGLRFGYGTYGPLPGLAVASDGVTFQTNNTLVCNPRLTGNAGVVYLITRSGCAMALKMNSTDYGYTLWRWSGKKWVRL